MTLKTIHFAALTLLASASLFGQFPPGRPEPTPTLPSGPREPDPRGQPRFTPPDPCQERTNQPILTLSLSPAEIYKDDQITVSWEVRDRRPGTQWKHPVHLDTVEPRPPFPEPAKPEGTHTYLPPSWVSLGSVTLHTLCGEKRVRWKQVPDATLSAVQPEYGAGGSTVHLRGSHFGASQGSSRVEIVADGQRREMTVVSWGQDSIDVTVPNGIPIGPATIRVVKGGRRETRERAFRVELPFSVLRLRLTPGHAGGALTFPSATDSFEADVQIGGDFENWLLPDLRSWASQLKREIGDNIHSSLNTAGTRNLAATAIMARVRDLGVGQIVAVTPSGNHITVEYE